MPYRERDDRYRYPRPVECYICAKKGMFDPSNWEIIDGMIVCHKCAEHEGLLTPVDLKSSTDKNPPKRYVDLEDSRMKLNKDIDSSLEEMLKNLESELDDDGSSGFNF